MVSLFVIHIHLVCFGKLKTQGYAQTQAHYQKLASKWCKWQETELKPDPHGNLSADLKTLENTLAKFPQTHWTLLSEKGKNITTQDWAKKIEQTTLTHSHLGWIIGPALGWSPEVFRKYPSISLGAQTMSHELTRIVLTEQIARALSLMHGHPYHHA